MDMKARLSMSNPSLSSAAQTLQIDEGDGFEPLFDHSSVQPAILIDDDESDGDDVQFVQKGSNFRPNAVKHSREETVKKSTTNTYVKDIEDEEDWLPPPPKSTKNRHVSAHGNSTLSELSSDDGRLQLRPDITLEGPQYSGKKSDRNEAFGEDEKKWQLVGDGMTRKRLHGTRSDSESISVEEFGSEEDEHQPDIVQQDDEMEALAKEYTDLREQEENLLKSLKKHGDKDSDKGQAVRNQKILWDKALEIRISLQKVFSSSNRLPQASVKSCFCTSDTKIDRAYSELISSARQTLDCLLDLQEVLVEKNNPINEAFENGKSQSGNGESQENGPSSETDATWARINTLYTRIAPFRNNAVDKWHRKTQLSAGAAAMKSKLRAFNQSMSQQVASYMKDPSTMMRRMQLLRSSVDVIGTSPKAPMVYKQENTYNPVQEANEDGDPELLDDSEFYQHLLQDFLESTDPTSLGTSVNSIKRMKRKRKVVDRRASKSRKIRYHVHEKIVNFMAPEPTVLPPMAPKLFSNLFGQQ